MSGALPAWLERLLREEPGRGEGTLWSLEHTWRWPPWVTLLLVVFAVVFVVAIYLRESPRAGRPYRILLAGIRLAMVAIVLAMISQLALSLQRTGLPCVAVLLDDSLSMTIVDRYPQEQQEAWPERVERAGFEEAELSRWNLARTLLTEEESAMLAGIADDYKLRLYFLIGPRSSGELGVEGLTAEIKGWQPRGEASRLGAAVRTVLDQLRGTAPAAIVLLTDGINTDGPSLSQAAALARRRGVPLFAVGLGSDQPVCDLKLSDLLVDPVVFVDDVVNFEVKLSGTGFRGRQVPVVLREEGKREVLTQVEVTLGAEGQPQQVRIPYRPRQVGRFRYVVEVEPQQGELQTDNNRQVRPVEVRKEKIRVLLVQAYPSFEFRFLLRMLQRDETIELKSLLQDADLEYAEQEASAIRVFPVRRKELFFYDVIILGDVNPALLSTSMMRNLADFVDQPGKGGALVLIAGPKYMPAAFRDTRLARLMPVDLTSLRYPDPDQAIVRGFVVQPTELGLASPSMQLGDTPAETETIWRNLPPLYWLVQMHELKAGARVLAVDPSRRGHDGRPLPVICLQYVGAGKVLMHATDETWRWRYRVGDVFFARYWIQTIRYLSRSKLAGGDRSATLSTDRREYELGEPVRLRVRFADDRLAPAEEDGVTVVLERPGHPSQRIRLRRAAGRGVFEGLLARPAVGDYHAWVAIPPMEGRAPAVDFSVSAPPGEFEQVRMDAAGLRRAAEQTGGRFYTFQTARRLLRDLPPGRQVPIESLPPKPLWNQWPVLLLFLVLAITEWVLRKVRGMV